MLQTCENHERSFELSENFRVKGVRNFIVFSEYRLHSVHRVCLFHITQIQWIVILKFCMFVEYTLPYVIILGTHAHDFVGSMSGHNSKLWKPIIIKILWKK